MHLSTKLNRLNSPKRLKTIIRLTNRGADICGGGGNPPTLGEKKCDRRSGGINPSILNIILESSRAGPPPGRKGGGDYPPHPTAGGQGKVRHGLRAVIGRENR